MTLRALVLALVAVLVLLNPAAAGAAAEGQLTWAVHISLAPTWFDPAETPGMITPYLVLYALHDALIKPLPGQPKAPASPSRGRSPRTASSTSSCCARARSSTTASR
jgi:peptide/nickel transport system substrate-binding protein